jgi:hypothetical protein
MFGGINRKLFSLQRKSVNRIASVMGRPKNLSTMARIGGNATSIGGTALSMAGLPEVGVPMLALSGGLMATSKAIDQGRQINKDRRLIRR